MFYLHQLINIENVIIVFTFPVNNFSYNFMLYMQRNYSHRSTVVGIITDSIINRYMKAHNIIFIDLFLARISSS